MDAPDANAPTNADAQAMTPAEILTRIANIWRNCGGIPNATHRKQLDRLIQRAVKLSQPKE